MSKNKQYKNVYTILEKVKKGEIQTHYKEKEGLFGKLNFYKKADLVKPYIHYIDEDKIDAIVNAEFRDQKSAQQAFNKWASHSSYRKLEEDKKPDFNAFYKKLQENYRKFPEHLKYDIHKMYYHKIDKLEFEERTEKNHTRYKFLEKANNPVGKIMSESSNLKSAVFTKNMMLYYLLQMTQLEYVDASAADKIKNGLNGESDFDNDGVDDALDDMFNNTASKNLLEKLMQDAQETCKMMDENMEQDVQERLFDQANQATGNEAGKLSPDYMRNIAARLANVRLSMTSLKEKIKKLLDKSASYFSARKITTYEDLFNAQDISGLEDYELLHPKLRKIFAEDIQIKDTKSVGKIDVYIDISGSMSSSCGVNSIEGRQISKIDFAKSITAKLKELDMLNEVYLFDTRVKKYRNDLISISMIDCGGGTTINNAVHNIDRVGNNALVITDAEDHCDHYSDKAFFIGVHGARFNHFNTEVIKQYSNKGQVVVFDGEKIHKVAENGLVVK